MRQMRTNDTRLGFMKKFMLMANSIVSGALHECPYKGKFLIINGGINHNKGRYSELSDSMQVFPNGYYILSARCYNKNDTNIGSFSIYYDNFYRGNHLEGFESL